MILVTGATGHVGRAVICRLASLGRDVVAMVRDVQTASRRLPFGIALRVADYEDAYALKRALAGIDDIGILEFTIPRWLCIMHYRYRSYVVAATSRRFLREVGRGFFRMSRSALSFCAPRRSRSISSCSGASCAPCRGTHPADQPQTPSPSCAAGSDECQDLAPRYVGRSGRVIGMKTFGASAPLSCNENTGSSRSV